MWVPTSAGQIEAAARAGELSETASFDGKKQLPVPRKNESLAVDVAAMSTDGGVLLYGLGEDKAERLTVEAPFELAGSADRVAQIVQTSIMEPPHIEVRELPTDADPQVGYLLVIVPQSARAPHQVTVNGDLRFYGRGAKGNRVLTEGEIARLYQRRLAWDQDREELLRIAISTSRFTTHQGTLIAFARPVLPDHAIWDGAVMAAGGRAGLQDALAAAARRPQAATIYDPSFGRSILSWHQLGSDEVRLSSLQRGQDPADAQHSALEASLWIDGSAELFSARAAFQETSPMSGFRAHGTVVMEFVIAGNLTAFLAVVSRLYDLGGYHGHVDIGFAVAGLEGGVSITIRDRLMHSGSFDAREFRRHERVAAIELREPKKIVSRMLRPLFELTTGDPGFDAFAWTAP